MTSKSIEDQLTKSITLMLRDNDLADTMSDGDITKEKDSIDKLIEREWEELKKQHDQSKQQEDE